MKVYDYADGGKITRMQKQLRYIKVAMDNRPVPEEYRVFRLNLLKDNVLLINKVASYPDSSPQNTFLIVDNRVAANFAVKKGYGFAVYLKNGEDAKYYMDATYVINDLSCLSGEKLERMLLRFLNIPWIILETERCIVRELTEEDTEELYPMCEKPEICRYTEKFFRSEEEEQQYLKAYRQCQYGVKEYGMWGIVRKSDNRLIGRVGIYDREGYKSPELGYVINKTCHNQGYAKEVTRAVVDYAKSELGIKQLNAFIAKENIPSKRILRELGFSWKQHVRIDNGIYEWCIYESI